MGGGTTRSSDETSKGLILSGKQGARGVLRVDELAPRISSQHSGHAEKKACLSAQSTPVNTFMGEQA